MNYEQVFDPVVKIQQNKRDASETVYLLNRVSGRGDEPPYQ